MHSQPALSARTTGHTVPLQFLVEDDQLIGEMLVDAVRSETPYQVLLLTDAEQALEAVKTVTPSLLILDYRLPEIDGLELADRLRVTEGVEVLPVLMISAYSPDRHALRTRTIPFLKKPFRLDDLLRAIRKLVPYPEL